MLVSVEERPEALRIWCAGALEVSAARSLLRSVDAFVSFGRPVVLDLGGVLEVDIIAATIMAQTVRRLRESGLSAVVVSAGGDLAETFTLLGCSDVLGRDSLGPR